MDNCESLPSRAHVLPWLLVSVLVFVVPLVEVDIEDDETSGGQARHQVATTEAETTTMTPWPVSATSAARTGNLREYSRTYIIKYCVQKVPFAHRDEEILWLYSGLQVPVYCLYYISNVNYSYGLNYNMPFCR